MGGYLDDMFCSTEIYGNVVVRNISWGGRWDEVNDEVWSYLTFSDNCVDEDPLFQSSTPRNFRLQDDSPAYHVGFKPIPFEKIGLYENEYRRQIAPRTIVNGCESYLD